MSGPQRRPEEAVAVERRGGARMAQGPLHSHYLAQWRRGPVGKTELGRALADAGHEVIVATGPNLQGRVAEEGFATALAGPSAMEGAMHG